MSLAALLGCTAQQNQTRTLSQADAFREFPTECRYRANFPTNSVDFELIDETPVSVAEIRFQTNSSIFRAQCSCLSRPITPDQFEQFGFSLRRQAADLGAVSGSVFKRTNSSGDLEADWQSRRGEEQGRVRMIRVGQCIQTFQTFGLGATTSTEDEFINSIMDRGLPRI